MEITSYLGPPGEVSWREFISHSIRNRKLNGWRKSSWIKPGWRRSPCPQPTLRDAARLPNRPYLVQARTHSSASGNPCSGFTDCTSAPIICKNGWTFEAGPVANSRTLRNFGKRNPFCGRNLGDYLGGGIRTEPCGTGLANRAEEIMARMSIVPHVVWPCLTATGKQETIA